VPRSITAVVCAALLVAAAGCGQSDQEKAREVVQEYIDASNDGDYERVCELYSEDFKRQLAVDDCPAFVEEQTSGVEQELELVDVRADGDRATAQIDAVRQEEGGTARIGLLLERADGDEWRITDFQ
jgi:ketosteroid isomerase-like protein